MTSCNVKSGQNDALPGLLTLGEQIGIIGGSGLSNPDILRDAEEKTVDTPYGKPSDALKIGKIQGVPCVLLSRHGKGHTIMPTNVNYRANVWALKEEGCTHLVVTTACGSLQEGIHPGDIVLLDQFIDRTQKRQQTFYDGAATSPIGICHMSMVEPFCPETRKILSTCIEECGFRYRNSGTCLTIEGPRFSSKAESKLWHAWGADVVNMTTVPEVVLAKEAGLCYAALALVTDYDSWREGEEGVNVEEVMKTFKLNSQHALAVLMKAIPAIAKEDWSAVLKANKEAVKMNVLLPHGY